MDSQVLTVKEVAEAIGISKNSAYEAIRNGEIPALRIGRRIVVPKRVLDQLLDAVGAPDDP